jgi:hypothetical protein
VCVLKQLFYLIRIKKVKSVTITIVEDLDQLNNFGNCDNFQFSYPKEIQ